MLRTWVISKGGGFLAAATAAACLIHICDMASPPGGRGFCNTTTFFFLFSILFVFFPCADRGTFDLIPKPPTPSFT
jgi:hypothetical protein